MELIATPWGLACIDGNQAHLFDVPYRSFGELLVDTGSLNSLTIAPVKTTMPKTDALRNALAPVTKSSAVWGVGLNYYSKVITTGRAVPSEPILFALSGASVSGPAEKIPFPVGCTSELDYEAEIAVVIGSPLYRTDARDVWRNIAAVTAANDITARDVMRQTQTPALAKSFAGCKPIGPTIRTIEGPEDLRSIGVQSYVNGELRQEDSNEGMIWPIPELLSRLSWFAPLKPGDVFLSGTPSGTGQDRNEYLCHNDEIEIQVSGIHPLVNQVRHEDAVKPAAATSV